MSDYTINDPRFERLVIGHAKLERLWTGGRWLEGPAYFPAGRYLVFSDIPDDRVMRYDDTNGAVSVFREPSFNANGHTIDQEGRLVSCEHRRRCISRTEHDGSVRIVVDRFQGRRLNSPNDVVVKSDGSIWFSDPTYGIDGDYEGDAARSEIGASNVYCWNPRSGEVRAVVTDRVKPNGLAFSPDEGTLYVADTGASHVEGLPRTITAYSMDGGCPSAARELARLEEGFFDGMRCDAIGNVWTSAGKSVRCYSPDGTHLGTLPVPEVVSNVCFGSPKRNRLFVTAQTSLYAIFLDVRGAAPCAVPTTSFTGFPTAQA